MVNLLSGDNVVAVKQEDGQLVAIAADSGHIVIFPVDQVPVMVGPAQGVRMIKLAQQSSVISMETVTPEDALRVQPQKGKEKVLRVNEIPESNRATMGKKYFSGIVRMERLERVEGKVRRVMIPIP